MPAGSKTLSRFSIFLPAAFAETGSPSVNAHVGDEQVSGKGMAASSGQPADRAGASRDERLPGSAGGIRSRRRFHEHDGVGAELAGALLEPSLAHLDRAGRAGGRQAGDFLVRSTRRRTGGQHGDVSIALPLGGGGPPVENPRGGRVLESRRGGGAAPGPPRRGDDPRLS